jgi:hypothetical protein
LEWLWIVKPILRILPGMSRVTLALSAVLWVAVAAPARAEEPAFVLQPAAVLDAAPFAYAISLRALAGAEGVSRVPLGPALIAAAREDLADLRVVDGASRQWPFVLVRDAGQEAIALRVEGPRVAGGSSSWTLVPPVSPAVVSGITLRVDRESFDRGYRLLGSVDGHDAPLAAGRLTRRGDQPPEITVTLPRRRVAELTLVVDDGDEAPLPLSAARASSPVAELRLVAPAGGYTLLLGDAGARAPRYEIAGVRDRVLAAHAGTAELGPLAPNPAYASPKAADPRHSYALWLVMGLAVVALGALTLRLSGSPDPPARG